MANSAVVALTHHQRLEDASCAFCARSLVDLGARAERPPAYRFCLSSMGGCGREQAAPTGGHDMVASPLPRLQYGLVEGKLWLAWRRELLPAPVPESESDLSEEADHNLVSVIRPMSLGGDPSEAEMPTGPSPFLEQASTTANGQTPTFRVDAPTTPDPIATLTAQVGALMQQFSAM